MTILETICRAFGVVKPHELVQSDDELRRLVQDKAAQGDVLAQDFITSHRRYFSPFAESSAAVPPPVPVAAPVILQNPKRNLLYHVGPIKGNGTWQRNVAQIRQRMHLFNGRRVVAIMTDEQRDPPDEVKRAFDGDVEEYIVMRNNPALREVVSWYSLLDRVVSLDPNEITFSAHTKAVTKGKDEVTSCHKWTTIQYETCLDYMPLVESVLNAHPIAGSFLKVGLAFDGKSTAPWHYSGTYYWFRNADVFSREWWRIDQAWFGSESWPGLHFALHEAGLLFMHGTNQEMDLYNIPYFERVIEPAYAAWRLQHANERRG